jgi:6-phosphogluconolactonase
VALLALTVGAVAGCASGLSATSELVYVGAGIDGGQLRALRLDTVSGKLSSVGPVAQVAKPRWAVAHAKLPMLYVASDVGAEDGHVLAFAVDRASGSLKKVSEVAAGGSGTTHLDFDLPSMTLLAANFGGGSTSSIAVHADGKLDTLVSTIKSTGSGPNRRQAGPHAHGVAVDPSGRFALVADLGADRVFVYALDRATHALAPAGAFAVPPGSGPHHLAFGLDGRFVYLLNELSADVTTLRWDAQSGTLRAVQALPITSEGFQGAKSASELAVSPDGSCVYVSDRGENSLLVYRVNAETGELSLMQRIAAGGELPWSFAIDAAGRWLLVANQRSNSLNLFSIDAASGRLTDTGQAIEVPAPLSVTFMN